MCEENTAKSEKPASFPIRTGMEGTLELFLARVIVIIGWPVFRFLDAFVDHLTFEETWERTCQIWREGF